jgi:hypothetical protein
LLGMIQTGSGTDPLYDNRWAEHDTHFSDGAGAGAGAGAIRTAGM